MGEHSTMTEVIVNFLHHYPRQYDWVRLLYVIHTREGGIKIDGWQTD